MSTEKNNLEQINKFNQQIRSKSSLRIFRFLSRFESRPSSPPPQGPGPRPISAPPAPGRSTPGESCTGIEIFDCLYWWTTAH